jgi:hypothetical protein
VNKPQTTLKALAATATTGAATNLGIQISHGDTSPASITFTTLAVLLVSVVLADDTARIAHTVLRRFHHRRPTTGPEFAKAHGNDSSTWTSADFDAEYTFAEIDIQPAWLLAHPQPAPQTTPTA